MKTNIQRFYTGGGITLVEAHIDPNHVAVVTSEAIEYLTVYKEGEEPYLPENMLYSIQENDMNAEMKVLYAEMLKQLDK